MRAPSLTARRPVSNAYTPRLRGRDPVALPAFAPRSIGSLDAVQRAARVYGVRHAGALGIDAAELTAAAFDAVVDFARNRALYIAHIAERTAGRDRFPSSAHAGETPRVFAPIVDELAPF